MARFSAAGSTGSGGIVVVVVDELVVVDEIVVVDEMANALVDED